MLSCRRNKLESFWKGQFGHTHGLIVATRFYENVEIDGKNERLEFVPRTGEPMLIACLWSHWADPKGMEPDLLSFAAITDDPESASSALLNGGQAHERHTFAQLPCGAMGFGSDKRHHRSKVRSVDAAVTRVKAQVSLIGLSVVFSTYSAASAKYTSHQISSSKRASARRVAMSSLGPPCPDDTQ